VKNKPWEAGVVVRSPLRPEEPVKKEAPTIQKKSSPLARAASADDIALAKAVFGSGEDALVGVATTEASAVRVLSAARREAKEMARSGSAQSAAAAEVRKQR
jgi:hypothetical protein